MTLQEYADSLNKFLNDNPSYEGCIVVSSSDDEGNSFNPVHYTPSAGRYEDREFQQYDGEMQINAVCIN